MAADRLGNYPRRRNGATATALNIGLSPRRSF
jgi:hypothetical protein